MFKMKRENRACPYCNKTVSNGYFNTHLRVHTREKPFKCEMCSKSFVSKLNLQRHSNTHSDDKSSKFQDLKHKEMQSGDKYSCTHCKKLFKTERSLKKHIKYVHMDEFKIHECKICGKKYAGKSDLLHHIATHTGERPFKCNQCEKTFIAKSHLNKHIRIHSTEKPYKCKICFSRFKSQGILTRHKKQHEKTRKTYDCNKCDKKYFSSQNLKIHMALHEAKTRSFKCKLCAKPFYTEYQLREHMICHSHAAQRCYFCRRSSSSLKNLNQHMKIHTNERVFKFKCETCGKLLYAKKQLINHMTVHESVRKYPCPMCEKCFKLKSYVQIHIRSVHLNERFFKCPNCNKDFLSNHMLKNHIEALHPDPESVQIYNCKICMKSFRTGSALGQHMYIYHRPKRFKCYFCLNLFWTFENLKAHFVSWHTNEIQWRKCNICFQRKRREAMKAHMRKFHNIEG